MATLNVKVVPGASRDRVVGRYGDGVKVQVSAPPEGGKANKAAIEVNARAPGVRAQPGTEGRRSQRNGARRRARPARRVGQGRASGLAGGLARREFAFQVLFT